MDMHQAAILNAAELQSTLARLAAEWLSWSQLREGLLKQQAPDPLTVEPVEMNIRRAVDALLDPARPSAERERTVVALRAALSAVPEVGLLWLRHTGDPTYDGLPPGALQTMLKARNDVFGRWHAFQHSMLRAGLAVCQVFVKQRFSGSGFLVGDRYVLTAHHCVEALIENGQQSVHAPDDLYIVFDDLVLPGETRSTYRTEVSADRDWLVHCSAPDDDERKARSPLQDIRPGCLDFALIRLAEPAGNMAPKHMPSMKREWIDLADLAAAPTPQAQMLIAHYPGGADLCLSVGLFSDHANEERRIRYLSPTVVGSSGAPCFSMEWKPYALHNAGYEAAYINQGVPLRLIWEALGHGARLAPAAATSYVVPPVAADGRPILGRVDLMKKVDAVLADRSKTRIFSVTGPSGSGKHYTAELLRTMLLDRGCQTYLLDATTFAGDTPEAFSHRLVAGLQRDATQDPQPSEPDMRQRARWISRTLAKWTRTTLERSTGPGGASTWIILERCDRAQLAPETQELLVAVLREVALLEFGPLRIILTGYGGDLLALPAESVHVTELDLLTGKGAYPYMDYSLAMLSMPEDPAVLRNSADGWAEAVANCNVNSIPAFVDSLIKWRSAREASCKKLPGPEMPAGGEA